MSGIAYNKWFTFLLVLIIFLGAFACDQGVTTPEGEDPPSEEPTHPDTQSGTYADTLESGWALYGSQSYEQAIQKFDEVVEADTLIGDANCGLAWSFARLDSLTKSNAYADSAIQGEYKEPDIYLLKGAILMTDQDYDSALQVLPDIDLTSDSWVFTNDNTINYQALLITTAYARFYMGEFDRVTPIIHDMDETLSFDASADGPWEYDGHQYEQFEDLLLAVLNDFTGLLVTS